MQLMAVGHELLVTSGMILRRCVLARVLRTQDLPLPMEVLDNTRLDVVLTCWAQ